MTVEKRDISVAGRIIAAFPDFLDTKQVQEDELAKLGEVGNGGARVGLGFVWWC